MRMNNSSNNHKNNNNKIRKNNRVFLIIYNKIKTIHVLIKIHNNNISKLNQVSKLTLILLNNIVSLYVNTLILNNYLKINLNKKYPHPSAMIPLHFLNLIGLLSNLMDSFHMILTIIHIKHNIFIPIIKKMSYLFNKINQIQYQIILIQYPLKMSSNLTPFIK